MCLYAVSSDSGKCFRTALIVKCGQVAKTPALIAFSHAVFIGKAAQACKYLAIRLVEGSSYTFLTDFSCFLFSNTYLDCIGVLSGSSGIHHMPLLPGSLHPRRTASFETVIFKSSPSNMSNSLGVSNVTYPASTNFGPLIKE